MRSKTNAAGNAPQIFLRASTKEKRVIGEASAHGYFHGLHLSATLPGFMVDFVRSLGRPFFIDPVLYQFIWNKKGLKNDKGFIKPSVKKIADKYGDPVKKHAGRRPLKPDDFTSDWKRIDDMVANIMEFQNNILTTGQQTLDAYYDKYDIIDDEEEEEPIPAADPKPWALVAPYLPFKELDDPWYEVTLKLALKAAEQSDGADPLYPVILIPPNILENTDDIKRICDDYAAGEFSGYFIWVNKFSENNVNGEKASGLIELVRRLSSDGKPVYKLFGGYLSTLLHQHGLTGFSCGIGYGDSKNVYAYPGGGRGSGQPRYYIPRLHRSLELADAERLIREYPDLACRCEVCRSIYGDSIDKFPEMKESGRCQSHFMNSRQREITLIMEKGTEAAVKEMLSTADEFRDNELVDVGNLATWAQAISGE